MRRPPVQIATPESAAEVSREVKRLLRAAGIKTQLPTPKESILECAELVERGDLDLSDYDATLSDRTIKFFHTALTKVLGLLDRRTDVIYVDPKLHDSRRLFVTYHEVVHKVLPWQDITATQDDESTLSRGCRKMFEAEANYGAADIIFQCDRFEIEAKDYEVSIASAQYLSKRYNASYHATLRRFVERNHRPCLLLVLTVTSKEHENGKQSYFVVYSIPSAAFVDQFGDPLDLQYINPAHELGQILNGCGTGDIELPDSTGFPVPCEVQTFTNTFNTFALIQPKNVAHARRIVFFNA